MVFVMQSRTSATDAFGEQNYIGKQYRQIGKMLNLNKNAYLSVK